MLYREIIAVCSEIHTKHITTLCGQNVGFVNVKLVVYIVTTGLQRVNSHNYERQISQGNIKIRNAITRCVDRQSPDVRHHAVLFNNSTHKIYSSLKFNKILFYLREQHVSAQGGSQTFHLNMLLKLSVNLRTVQPRPRNIVLLNKENLTVFIPISILYNDLCK